MDTRLQNSCLLNTCTNPINSLYHELNHPLPPTNSSPLPLITTIALVRGTPEGAALCALHKRIVLGKPVDRPGALVVLVDKIASSRKRRSYGEMIRSRCATASRDTVLKLRGSATGLMVTLGVRNGSSNELAVLESTRPR